MTKKESAEYVLKKGYCSYIFYCHDCFLFGKADCPTVIKGGLRAKVLAALYLDELKTREEYLDKMKVEDSINGLFIER